MIGFRTLFYKEILRFWKVATQTITAPIVTALLYLRTGSLWPGILIHAANNLVALVALRMAGPEVEAPAPDVAASLATAAVFLALSTPFLVWFIRVHWPTRGTPTPYQAHEIAGGLPARHVEAVGWSGSGQPVRLTATATHLLVAKARPAGGSGQTLAVLPLERVRAVYTAPTPYGDQVVLLLHDGTWTTLRVRGGDPRATRDLTQVIAERVQLAGSPR